MELINKTGVPQKNPGDGLSAKEINAINNTVNKCVDAANSYLTDYCNINEEQNDYITQYTIYQAANLVPESRRKLGMAMRFLSVYGVWSEMVYVGDDLAVEHWTDENNWSSGNIFDGGEW